MFLRWGSLIGLVALVGAGAAFAQPGVYSARPQTLKLDAQTGGMLPTRGGSSLVDVDCASRPGGRVCSGSVRLLPRGAKTKSLVGSAPIASTSARLKQGSSKTLVLHLSPRARAAIRGDNGNVLTVTVEIRSNGRISRHVDLVDDFKGVLGHKRPDSTRFARRTVAGVTDTTETFEWSWNIPVRHYLKLPDFKCPANRPTVATNGFTLTKWNITNRLTVGLQGKLEVSANKAGYAGFNVPHIREEGGSANHYFMTGWPEGSWNRNSVWAPVAFDDATFSLKVTCIETEFPTSKAAFMYSGPYAWMFPWGYPD